KCRPRQEFVIGGYTEPAGSRKSFGSLLLGVYDGDSLRYVGRVGTGFGNELLASLLRRLERLARKTPPFVNPPRRGGVHWVEPELVTEISFATWTRDGQLRQAAFEGLRDDKPAREVKAERSSRAPGGARRPAPARTPRGGGAAERPSGKRAATADESAESVAGVRITHPARLVYAPEGITKIDLARYVAEASRWMLPHVVGRPLMILRCSQGVGQGPCFVQKHPRAPRAA